MQKYFEINKNGNNIFCKVYYNDLKTAKKAVLYCTGFAGHRDNKAAEGYAQKVLSKHKNVIIVTFDWPSHGSDVKKRLRLEDCDGYLNIILDEIKGGFGIDDVFVYATSFGAYEILRYIKAHGEAFKKIALRSPAVNMYESITGAIIQEDEYEKLTKGKDVRVGFDRKVNINMEFLESLKENDIRRDDYLDFLEEILIIHGTNDEVVSFDESKAFSENNLIEFIPVEGANHRFINPTHMSLANKLVTEFFGF